MKRTFLMLGLVGWGLYLFTAVWNVGIIALDDYTDVVSKIVPAQRLSLDYLVARAGIRSPLPPVLLLGVSKLAYGLGVVSPLGQLRLVLAVWGSLAFLSFFFSVWLLWGDRRGRHVFPDLAVAGVGLFAFYFLAPLFFTRVMIESLAAPFLCLSAVFCVRYLWACEADERGRGWLAGAVLFLGLASLFRFQAGVCGLALLVCVFFWGRRRDLSLVVILAGAFYGLSGLIDPLFGRGFHQSLFSYLQYNLAHSSSYGTSPFYNYLLLFLGLSFPPIWLGRRQLWAGVVARYRPLVGLLVYFLVFVLAHSLVPHKEERFMISILGVFLLLLAPWVVGIWRVRWRRYLALGLNGVLLFFVVGNIPQNNVIGLARYLERHPEIASVYGVSGSLLLFPHAYLSRSVWVGDISLEGWRRPAAKKEAVCRRAFAVRQDIELRGGLPGGYSKIAEFRPGVLEDWIVRANPKRNARRGSIGLYVDSSCARAE